MSEIQPVIIQFREEEIKEILKRRLKFTSEAWGFASAYEAAITAAGYAAFFTIWYRVAADITPVARNLTASFMGISLFAYISWTMLQMWARHRFDREFADSIAKPQSAIEYINEWDGVEIRKMRHLSIIQHRYWPIFYGTALVSGVIGAAILTYSCLAVAIGLPQLTGVW